VLRVSSFLATLSGFPLPSGGSGVSGHRRGPKGGIAGGGRPPLGLEGLDYLLQPRYDGVGVLSLGRASHDPARRVQQKVPFLMLPQVGHLVVQALDTVTVYLCPLRSTAVFRAVQRGAQSSLSSSFRSGRQTNAPRPSPTE
jgi:hypothetical protein